MHHVVRSFALGLVLMGACLSTAVWANDWKAGAAKQKITPPGPMWMAGYGSRTHAATGLLNDLFARAVVFEDGAGGRVALVTLDLVGISPDVADPILAQLESKYRFSRDRVALCCSHTHSGPVVGRNLRTLHFDLVDEGQQQLVDRYAEFLKGTVVDLVGRAIDALAPCRVSFAQGTASFAVNRRNNKEPDVPQLRESGKLLGPIDHDVPVIKVLDASGKLTAVVFSYACHATVLDGYDWSSDYPGFAAAQLEADHAGATALFVAGCGADQNPLPRRKPELAMRYGRELASAVEAVLQQDLVPVEGPLKVRFDLVPLELANVPSAEAIEHDAQSSDRFIAARARLFRQRLSKGQAISSTYPYPIEAWRLGDKLTLVLLGGEVVVDYAIKIRAELGREQTFVAGYSNDVMAYIPSRRVLAEGGYEGGGAMVYYSLPSPWSESVEAKILDGVRAAVAGVK